jgi:hypothetical protein
MAVLLDTGPWVALLSRNDTHHPRVQERCHPSHQYTRRVRDAAGVPVRRGQPGNGKSLDLIRSMVVRLAMGYGCSTLDRTFAPSRMSVPHVSHAIIAFFRYEPQR